jgi:8-oxo-dGTP pyrophosphatase MutT (NUDIX family)
MYSRLFYLRTAVLFGLTAPSPANGEEAVGTGKILVDYKSEDYRGFIFVVHEHHGLMLLRCTRKKSKPPHWQLPGGHVDEEEFIKAGE